MIEIILGDLTASDCDALVNAANHDLQLGAGVAGAIRRQGGPSIQAECDQHGPIQIGAAAITGAGSLPAKYVIHAASMGRGHPTTADSLRRSTVAALLLGEQYQIESVAFPALGTGVSGFPVAECAEIMLSAVLKHLETHSYPHRVQFVLWDEPTFQIFQSHYHKLR